MAKGTTSTLTKFLLEMMMKYMMAATMRWERETFNNLKKMKTILKNGMKRSVMVAQGTTPTLQRMLSKLMNCLLAGKGMLKTFLVEGTWTAAK